MVGGVEGADGCVELADLCEVDVADVSAIVLCGLVFSVCGWVGEHHVRRVRAGSDRAWAGDDAVVGN